MRLSVGKCYNVTMLHRKRVEGGFLLYIYYILIYYPYIPQNRGDFCGENGVDFREKWAKNGEKRKEKCVIVRKRGYRDKGDVTM